MCDIEVCSDTKSLKMIKRHVDLTLFSMGYFKNTTVWGGAIMAPPPCNFAVS